jgi:hypothetical protein
VISYPSKIVESEDGRARAEQRGTTLDEFEQTNGQLMGSPLSFPILCIINLLAYWSAMEEYLGYRTPFWKLPCLINGDDILFRSNAEFYLIWQKWITIVGFTLSPGKNYISPHFLTVNSVSYLYSQKLRSFRKIPFLNTGILLEHAPGVLTSPIVAMSMAERKIIVPFIDKMEYVIHSSGDPERTFRRYVHYNLDKIKSVTQQGNYTLFGHPQTGGLGLSSLEGIRYTHFQVKYSQFLKRKIKLEISNKVTDPTLEKLLGTVKAKTILPGGSIKPYKKSWNIELRELYEPNREYDTTDFQKKGPLISNISRNISRDEVSWAWSWPSAKLLRGFRSTLKGEEKLHYKNRDYPSLGFRLVSTPATPYERELVDWNRQKEKNLLLPKWQRRKIPFKEDFWKALNRANRLTWPDGHDNIPRQSIFSHEVEPTEDVRHFK